ncbi:MAG: hypothetical protein IAE96_02185 [Chitinophagaceae bacterium]|nr:hypothetical protein [Chitinophagaceae bacterium]
MIKLRGNRRLPTSWLICFTLLFFYSCKNPSAEKSGFRMNCVLLTHAQVKSWADSGWTRPESPVRIQTILLQFFSPDADHSNDNMQLVAYPGTGITGSILNGRRLLETDPQCKPVQLKGNMILGNNEISLDSLGILKPDGQPADFEFVRFTPRRFSRDNEYITFDTEVVYRGKPEAEKTGPTYPCPPYCCPPECD